MKVFILSFQSEARNPRPLASNQQSFRPLIVGIQLAAFWPVWQWYAARFMDSPEDRWGLLALGALALFFARKGCERAEMPDSLWLPALLTLLYAGSYAFLPPLPRAAIAVIAVGCTLSVLRFGRAVQPGVWGLLLLSLPLIPSLQFYLGYPLRLIVASVAAPLIRLTGFAVVQSGVYLNWRDHPILIDAPCSGIKMLWAGFYLTFTLACFYRLGPARTAVVSGLAFVAIVLGNLFRATALFYIETGIVDFPAWTHTGIGLLTFALVAAGIVWGINKVKSEESIHSA
ncbi:MAG: exosortase/archaeosortase family protein [Gammaproteobacteria bacterium]|nr:exosortase/archaeosortase family protein [Gammaproteobacteria bacterium]